MTVSKEIKIIHNKIEYEKTQYDLDRQTAKISALSPGTVSKYEHFDCNRCFNTKRLARENCCNKMT